jgi:hypothetical protein
MAQYISVIFVCDGITAKMTELTAKMTELTAKMTE